MILITVIQDNAYYREYRRTHIKRSREIARAYYWRNHEGSLKRSRKKYIKRRGNWREYRQERKLKVLQIISRLEKPICANCGCDDIRILEVNHVYGGGAEERKKLGGQAILIKHLLDGTRDTDDLNVLCKVCNWLHHLRLKFGDIPMKVIWEGTCNP